MRRSGRSTHFRIPRIRASDGLNRTRPLRAKREADGKPKMTETEVTGLRTFQPAESGIVATDTPNSWALSMHRTALWLKSPRPYLMLIGFGLFLGFWYLSVEVLKLPRFAQMPGPTEVIDEWLNQDPTYGLSIFIPEYYMHIWVSTRRIAIAFFLATVTGVPLGLFLGWSQRFKQYVFPVF